MRVGVHSLEVVRRGEVPTFLSALVQRVQPRNRLRAALGLGWKDKIELPRWAALDWGNTHRVGSCERETSANEESAVGCVCARACAVRPRDS